MRRSHSCRCRWPPRDVVHIRSKQPFPLNTGTLLEKKKKTATISGEFYITTCQKGKTYEDPLLLFDPSITIVFYRGGVRIVARELKCEWRKLSPPPLSSPPSKSINIVQVLVEGPWRFSRFQLIVSVRYTSIKRPPTTKWLIGVHHHPLPHCSRPCGVHPLPVIYYIRRYRYAHSVMFSYCKYVRVGGPVLVRVDGDDDEDWIHIIIIYYTYSYHVVVW